MAFDLKKYKKFPLALRYKVVEEQGRYIACRHHLAYNIELFDLHGHYVEVWRSMAINQIYWIECPEPDYVTEKYVQTAILDQLFK